MIDLRVGRGRLAAAVALGGSAGGAGIALMGTAGWLLSRAAEQPPVLYLMVAIVAVRAFGLSRGLLRYLERLVGHDLGLRLQAALRVDTYRGLARSTWVGRRGGDVLSRVVNDVDAVQDLVIRVVVPMASAGLVAVATGVVLTVLSAAAGAVVFGAAVLAGVVVPWLTNRLAARSAAALAPLRGELAEVVAETCVAAPDLIAYGAGPLTLRRVATAADRLRRAEGRLAWSSGLAAGAQLLATGGAVLGALALGAGEVAAGMLPPVQLAVVVLTPLALHEVLAALPAAGLALARARSALARVADLHRAPAVGTPEHRSAPSPAWAATGIVVTGLSAGWPGQPAAVTGLDLAVARGEWVALVGPSGAGKTTVAATILGLLPPVAGTVATAAPVGYLAQDAYLFDTTVAENVRIGDRDADDARVTRALQRARVALPPDHLVGRHGAQISGGEGRRVALARLLVADHPALILDEPTEHLDAPTAVGLLADLRRATADAAVLVITHDPGLAASCDRVVSLPAATASARIAWRGVSGAGPAAGGGGRFHAAGPEARTAR